MNNYVPNLETRYVRNMSEYAEMRDLLADNAQLQLNGKTLITLSPKMNSVTARRGEFER